jgi:hypothetical protein
MANVTVVRTASQSQVNSLSQVGFKNKIINGGFDVWQRGTTFTGSLAGGTYTADRYRGSGTSVTAGSHTFSRNALAVNDLPLTEAGLTYYAKLAYSVAPTVATTYENRIENVRTLAGKDVTLSFYARINSGSFPLVFNVLQNLGTGGTGSPTTVVPTIKNSSGIVVTAATSSWARYTATFTVPSLSGMTIGTTGNDYLSIGLVRPSSGTPNFDITGIQLEEGLVATAFEQRHISTELALCQRYYQIIAPANTVSLGFGHIQTGTTERFTVPIPVTLRSSPAITATSPLFSVGTNGNFALSSFSVRDTTPNSVILEAISATAHTSGALVFFAQGASGGSIEFNSEL